MLKVGDVVRTLNESTQYDTEIPIGTRCVVTHVCHVGCCLELTTDLHPYIMAYDHESVEKIVQCMFVEVHDAES